MLNINTCGPARAPLAPLPLRDDGNAKAKIR
jgi:hypothetical protein